MVIMYCVMCFLNELINLNGMINEVYACAYTCTYVSLSVRTCIVLSCLQDEPTTGMDPRSRQLVWRAIGEAVAEGRSVILSSHR